jgi:3-dehydroquinate dehydratase-2
MKIEVINGVNLNMLGMREKQVYGEKTLAEINQIITDYCKGKGVEVCFYQSNIEGEICEEIQNSTADAIVLNAGAYTHYSIAIRDAISGASKRVVEVHISNLFAREEFRQKSMIAPVCEGTVCGFGYKGYLVAIESLLI